MKEWFTVADLLAIGPAPLPMSESALKRHIAECGWRERPEQARLEAGPGREGGTWHYHHSLFPAEVRARLFARQAPMAETAAARREAVSKSLWERFDSLPEKARAEAARRLAVVDQVRQLAAGMTRQCAVALAAREADISTSTLWTWLRQAEEVPPADRLPALAPKHVGRIATADIHPDAWDMIRADWLRPEAPTFEACARRMRAAAAEHGWSPIPSDKTLKRRLDAIPRAVQMLARKGAHAVEAVFPHQTRDRSIFTAMEAITADGHKFDVFVKWGDGSIGRPIMAAIQDLYSGMILAHRIGETENWTLVRHALADMVESWGIPERATLDNGRAWASKWLSGGAKTRYRFKIRDDDPTGLLPLLGVQIAWAKPYHGQSKPIERAFRDMCDDIAKHPRFAGAYTGNNPAAKPENYGAKAIPIETFRDVVAAEIAAHNRRPGRKTQTARGRSFHETFAESYASALVKRATEAQRRMLLLAAEGVTCRAPTGEVQLAGNRYWAEPLADLAGHKVTVRFDPDDLLAGVSVYRLDGRYVATAPCIEATGFADAAAAQEHARRKRQWMRAQRELLAAERRMTIDEVAALMPEPAPYQAPEQRVVKLVANGGRAPQPGQFDEEAFGAALRQLAEAGADTVTPFRRPGA